MAIVKGVNSNGNETQIKATLDGELKVRAIQESEIEHSSSTGGAFAFPSANTDIDAGDTRLFIKNTGDKYLILSYALFNPANVVCKYDIGLGSETTTPTGTVVTAINMNQSFSSTVESYLAYDDETAVADASIMMSATTNTTESLRVELTGVILGKNQYVQINQETESTSGQVTVFGHFEPELA